MKIRNLKLLGVAVMAGLGFAGHAQATYIFPNVTLGEAGDLANPQPQYNLGVFVTGPTQFQATSSGAVFEGNLGLASGATTNVSGGGTLDGTLYKDPGATLQGNFSSQFNVDGGIATESLSQAVSDVRNAASIANQLPANQTYTGSQASGGITISSTTGSGAYHNLFGGYDTVVDITGGINITNSNKDLTINGGTNDFFIINVADDISVNNGEITTSGGIPDSHILFNVLGAGNSVDLNNNTSILHGTYLAPDSGQSVTLDGDIDGAIIAYQVTVAKAAVSAQVFVPEPASLALLAVGGLALLYKYKRPRKRKA